MYVVEGLAMHIKIPVTAELYAAIIRDAGRHLRSADLHVVYLLRQSLDLEFPTFPRI
jgi:hypothetical protein